MSTPSHPIEGQIVLLAGAQASVTLPQLSALLERVHGHLAERRESYERRFECIECPDTVYYLVGIDHWDCVAADLHLEDREIDAVRRAHEEQFRRDGRRLDRLAEFETALDIRHPVALG